MKFEYSLIIFFCLVGVVFSQPTIPSIGFIQCKGADRNATIRCGQAVRSSAKGPFRFLNYSVNNTFRFSFLGNCTEGVEFARTRIPGCEECDTLANPPKDNIPICQAGRLLQ